jgi:non-canonical purine NTP pyrophosphatase (RdgB/HAM1 family)
MSALTLVTGNPSKLKEWHAIAPEIALSTQALELDEMQSLSLEEIAQRKARDAFAVLNTPVIVEDVGFFLDHWGGLPGPFIKYFETLYPRESLARLLGTAENRTGYAKACIAYYDGTHEFVVSGEVHGNISMEPRGPEGAFGFDYCLIPDGYEHTLAELGDDIKNTISHRRRAIDAFAKEYTQRFGE